MIAVSFSLMIPAGQAAKPPQAGDQRRAELSHPHAYGGADQRECNRNGRSWSQVVAVGLRVPADMVAVWSQSGCPAAGSDAVTWPLSCGDGGAPRGIRTPNRQIRSLVTVGPYATHPVGRRPRGVVDARSDARAARAPVSLIGRRDPGCRGVRTSSDPGADPVAQLGMPRSRGQTRCLIKSTTNAAR
jgi:hypothetical protein